VLTFLRAAFGSAVAEGYGQTEATAAVTVTDGTDHNAGGHVGYPLTCSEVKLVDVPDMNYTAADMVNGAVHDG
jgi:long-chain acyl-CoA synthetase